MKYLKIDWDEITFDEDWGLSSWYLEIGEDNYIRRQLEVFENSNRIKYDESHSNDSYGSLGDQPIELEELNGIVISAADFETEWGVKSMNMD